LRPQAAQAQAQQMQMQPQQQIPQPQQNGVPMNAATAMPNNRGSWPTNGTMSHPPYSTEAPQLPLNGLGQHDSNRSSRSNSINRPGSSGSGGAEDKKRFSNGSSLANVTNSLDTSPPNSVPSVVSLEQKFDPNVYQRDRLQQGFPSRSSPGYYQQAASTGATSLATQNDQPQFYYGRPGLEQYNDNSLGGVKHEAGFPEYFNPNVDNSLMFSHQQQ